ncbi:aminotransferase class V-fold PLP-dependent enzyme [Lysinibacillus sp. 54212]|uniref:aminotransferase class V-fold PLP-dependent enzyme n=1 Tax=Lysinibacillus sp. 54212 TaxID=3119829 RepID=UPI002FC71B51
MYWCKIATTDHEFNEIAALTYETFVEEIPQHKPNKEKRLVDRFHHENTYVVVYKHSELVGMVTFRDQRPFSLDEKIGEIEQFISPEQCEKLCELRLLAVKKEHRNGRVLMRLMKALYAYFFHENYSACVISGTTRQEKLYKQIGFTQFATAFGTEEAKYLPMVLTKEKIHSFKKRLLDERYTFYPGPVLQQGPLGLTNLSHRSPEFSDLYDTMIHQLLLLSGARNVTTLVGSGTLANEAMLGQLKSDFNNDVGIIISNGEFGERLASQAQAWQLQFQKISYAWGEPFQLKNIKSLLEDGQYKWLLFVHGETSTGTINPINELAKYCRENYVKLCADCISSFGSKPFSMDELYLATAVSGKAIGALSGLSFVFSNETFLYSNAPRYLNLPYYNKGEIPFTIPAYLVQNVARALLAYPQRYQELENRMNQLLSSDLFHRHGIKTSHYPMIATLQCNPKFSRDAKLNGLFLHDESNYLKRNMYTQISVIGPDFTEAFKKLQQYYDQYLKVLQKSEQYLG